MAQAHSDQVQEIALRDRNSHKVTTYSEKHTGADKTGRDAQRISAYEEEEGTLTPQKPFNPQPPSHLHEAAGARWHQKPLAPSFL